MAYERPPPPPVVIDRHVCEPGEEGVCMAYWCRKPVGPACPATAQERGGVHCVHWWDDRKTPCCKCGDNGQEESPCDPESPSAPEGGATDE